MSTTLKVADIMTRKVHVLYEEDNLQELRKHMNKYSMRHLPVVDDGRVVGLVTHRDVLSLAVSALDPPGVAQSRENHIEETFVNSVMTRDVKTITKDAKVSEAAKVMVDGHLGCLPVVNEENKLVGIITEYDILRAVAHSL